jgi:hypothetical protein
MCLTANVCTGQPANSWASVDLHRTLDGFSAGDRINFRLRGLGIFKHAQLAEVLFEAASESSKVH